MLEKKMNSIFLIMSCSCARYDLSSRSNSRCSPHFLSYTLNVFYSFSFAIYFSYFPSFSLVSPPFLLITLYQDCKKMVSTYEIKGMIITITIICNDIYIYIYIYIYHNQQGILCHIWFDYMHV
jgi:hypothetical protein